MWTDLKGSSKLSSKRSVHSLCPSFTYFEEKKKGVNSPYKQSDLMPQMPKTTVCRVTLGSPQTFLTACPPSVSLLRRRFEMLFLLPLNYKGCRGPGWEGSPGDGTGDVRAAEFQLQLSEVFRVPSRSPSPRWPHLEPPQPHTLPHWPQLCI